MNGAGEPADGRHRRGRRHRERIYRAAIDLFVEHGFDATTMDEIAQRAQVARATVFNHFPRKASFVDESSARRRERARAAADTAAGTHPAGDVLTRYLLELARANEEARAEIAAFLGAATRATDAAGRSHLPAEIAELAREARSRGELRPDVDPDTIGLVLAGAYFAVLERWVADPRPFELGEKLVEALDVVLTGVRARP